MKKILTTIILLAGIALNVFAQQEIPMFFDNDLMLQTDANSNVAYSPDGSKIATVFNKGKIAIWDAATGRIITKLAGHGDKSIGGIVFSSDSRRLVSFYTFESAIRIWDATSGTLTRSISQENVGSASFSPDGSHIAGAYYVLGSNDDVIKIWNTANGSEIRTIAEQTSSIRSITYSPNGRQILTATNEGIRVWDAGNGQRIRIIDSETRYERAIFSPNGRYIAAYINRRNSVYAIRIFNAETGQEIQSIPVQLYPYDITYSPDGKQLLVNARGDNENILIKIFDPETGRELRSFNNGDIAVAFSPDGRRILTASTSFRLKSDDKTYGASYATLLDATTGKVTGTIGYGPLNVGARAYADMQIARFLADTAAVNRHEAVLKFITDRGNATRAEIEKFYRDNIRALITAVVDEEAAKRQPTNPATIAEIKQLITNFFLNPTMENHNALHRKESQYASTDGQRGVNAARVLIMTVSAFDSNLSQSVLDPSLLVTQKW